MKENGYISLAAVGTIILLLSASFVTYFEWNRHQSEKEAIYRQGSSQLSFDLISERSALNEHIERTLNESLWKIGKNGKSLESGESEVEKIENLAENELNKKLQDLSPKTNLYFPSEGESIRFEISRGEENGTVADVELPKGTSLEGNTPDGSTTIEIPIDKIKETTSPRFFLLQDKMDEFGEDLNSVERRWKYFEYALAYSQAWLDKDLNFSKKRSEILFRLALATHEFDKFGSSDYESLLREVVGSKVVDMIESSDMEPDQFSEPLRNPSVKEFSEKTEKSLNLLKSSKAILHQAKSNIDNLKKFDPEERLTSQSQKISNLSDNYEQSKDDFSKICEDTRTIYAFPRDQLNKSLEKIREAIRTLKRSRNCFNRGLDAIESSKEDNPFLKNLYQDITQSEPRGVSPQINCGFKSVLENLDSLEEDMVELRRQLPETSEYEKTFPDGYRERLSDDMSENEVDGLFSEAHKDAEESFLEYIDDYEEKRSEVEEAHDCFSREIESQTKDTRPNWSDTYTKYPGPGERGDSEEMRVEKYVIRENQGSISGLETVLERTESQLDRIENLNKDFDEERGKLERFGLNQSLKNIIKEGGESPDDSISSRKEEYELSPPTPVENAPNISVYHDLDIDSVQMKRLDPVGLVDKSGPPTPIYIWQIKTTIFWGLWDVKIEIEEPLVEEIFDYPNQVIPRPKSENSNQYFHKPLPYERHFEKSEYNFKLLVLSLRNFDISY